MRLQVIAEAPPAQPKPTQRELHDIEVAANAVARAAEQAAKQAALEALKISYTQFLELVDKEYAELVPAWYNAGGLCVLPPERKIVNARQQSKKGHVPAYWFVPQLYLSQRLLIEEWCSHVRWKIINGYGINVTAWCKEAEPSSYLDVCYKASGVYNKPTQGYLQCL